MFKITFYNILALKVTKNAEKRQNQEHRGYGVSENFRTVTKTVTEKLELIFIKSIYIQYNLYNINNFYTYYFTYGNKVTVFTTYIRITRVRVRTCTCIYPCCFLLLCYLIVEALMIWGKNR